MIHECTALVSNLPVLHSRIMSTLGGWDTPEGLAWCTNAAPASYLRTQVRPQRLWTLPHQYVKVQWWNMEGLLITSAKPKAYLSVAGDVHIHVIDRLWLWKYNYCRVAMRVPASLSHSKEKSCFSSPMPEKYDEGGFFFFSFFYSRAKMYRII